MLNITLRVRAQNGFLRKQQHQQLKNQNKKRVNKNIHPGVAVNANILSCTGTAINCKQKRLTGINQLYVLNNEE